ncbi:MAG: hypothetical protein SF052_08850 [Bacteroidia bacterium]|nr:hypothetical protein [Bacteroidia bacterium]
MLCIICTKKKLLAGVITDQPQLLTFDGKTHINYDSRSPHTVLKEHLPQILNAYEVFTGISLISQPHPTVCALAFPVDMNEYSKEKVYEVIDEGATGKLELIHSDNLVISYLHGLRNNNDLNGDNFLVLEAVDDYLNLCYSLKKEGVVLGDVKELGREALFTDEAFEFYPFKDFGRSVGTENVLKELLSEFSAAGLSVDVKGQTDLALQLLNPGEDFTFNVSKNTDTVSLEAEIKLTEEKYYELLTVNKEKFGDKLRNEALNEKQVKKVVLLGDFLRNKALQAYLEQDLNMNGKLFRPGDFSSEADYFAIIRGLSVRTAQVQEAEKIRLQEENRKRQEEELRRQEEERRRQEEEKRRKISAELKIKEERELLLADIRANCTDPDEKETYESIYISRGASLGIPDVVIKWNISEVLSSIELTKEINESSDELEIITEEVIADTTPETPSAVLPEPIPVKEEILPIVPIEPITEPEIITPAVVETQPEPVAETQPEPVVLPVVEEPVTPIIVLAPTPKPEVKPEPKQEPKPQPLPELVSVAAPVETKGTGNKGEKEITKEVVMPAAISNGAAKIEKPENRDFLKELKAAKMSLNDLFLIKGALKDSEFSTKKVTLYADHEPKVVKVLSAKEVSSPQKVERFLKLYDKELTYYMEMSEIGVAKEGLYYFRDYIERTTLKEHIGKIGLDKKVNVEDLNSSDLKFILQIFREVRELNVSHADLTDENILVVSRRKWNLQKNMEIKFVGFTSEDVAPEQMIEQTHKVFAKLMGEAFYNDFREKFQL